MARVTKVKALADELPAALKKGATVDPLALVAGASLEAIDALGKKKLAALHLACAKGRSDVVAALIARGASLSLPGKDGDTPLHIAALKRDVDSVRLLLAAGADVRALNGPGESALHSAAFGGSRECVEAIMGRPDAPDLNAVGKSRLGVVSFACKTTAGKSEDAALDLTRWLIERGASPNVVEAGWYGPVYFACWAKWRRLAGCVAERSRAVDARGLLAALAMGYSDVADSLVAHTGGEAGYADAARDAFSHAAMVGRVPECEWVLARWPEVPVHDPAVSEVALRQAINAGDLAMVDYLLGLGAPAEVPVGGSPTFSILEQAMMHKQWAVAARLIAHGASTEIRWREEHLAHAPAELRALFGA